MPPASVSPEPIWLLATRGRPHLAQAVLDACEETGMTRRALLWVDETVEQYQDMRLPKNWKIKYWKRWGGIAAAMNWVFKNYPNATQYGWLADDSFPRTEGWDVVIEKSAGDWKLASGLDHYVSDNRQYMSMLRRGEDFGAPMCWGGELVRAVGWWALPGVKQAGIDTAWAAIVAPLGLHAYDPSVVCEHMNYRTGKRPKDETDDWTKDGVNYIQNDIDERNRWVASDDYKQTIFRVKRAMRYR